MTKFRRRKSHQCVDSYAANGGVADWNGQRLNLHGVGSLIRLLYSDAA